MPDYSVEQWLAVVCGRAPQPSFDYVVVAFPSDEVRSEYLSSVASRPESEVRVLLRTFLGESRSIDALDALHLKSIQAQEAWAGTSPVDDGGHPRFTEYERRVIMRATGQSANPTWEGLTWVLDLLPHWPVQAIETIRAYLLAHAQVLPDLRIAALADARDLIRSRYVLGGSLAPQELIETLLALPSRDFEFFVAAIFRRRGFATEVTPAQKDRGKDVIARRDGETIYIECKNWRGRVDSDVVAGLTGRVEIDRVTRGIVVGTSGFTTGPASAQEVASRSPDRITLVSGEQLLPLCNEAFGSDWPRRIDHLIDTERGVGG